ncbi:General stress protein 30 [Serratia quinivorans]|uniref:polysaccharide pyruvyl transferase family protein n=1 Tax=Serratia quinivorans TaxID=137545 RepID=UPI00217A79DD|nr:polysaccharide pyruvyl transferase family protein [Serratia quinivorans]CAI1546070.1 General stress protein 30 [Serratia quinivorans]
MNKMKVLNENLSVITSVVPKKSKIIYLDYPLHLNVGDLLILKGAEKFFSNMEYNVVARYSDLGSHRFFHDYKKVPDDVIIVLHGGGNFGDLYPAHQKLRERVIENYPGNKIIILPQTVHFSNKESMIASSQIFEKHNNLHIFCRDERSFELLSSYFSKKTYLCPDMAHSLYDSFPKQSISNVSNETLWMLRKDIEISEIPTKLVTMPEKIIAEDWEDICTAKDRAILKICHHGELLNNKLKINVIPVNAIWYSYTNRLVKRMNEYFMMHGEVVTSRMHGHILACLLGMKTKLIDNSYGKNSGYYNAWTKDVDGCEIANEK